MREIRTASRRGKRRAVAGNRRGFTLIETIVALGLLAGVVLTMSMSTVVSSRKVQTSGSRSRAQALADAQIARARSWPTYSTLTELALAKYNGTANGLTSTTVISIDSLAGRNLTKVAITVAGVTTANLAVPIVRSISIAAP